jgi:hypothetical protein
MEIQIKRDKELKKGLLGGSSLQLKLSINTVLSEEETNLIKKYEDPFIDTRHIQLRFEGTEEQYKTVKTRIVNNFLSKFNLEAWVDHFDYLGSIQDLETAVCKALTYKMEFLKALDAWEGEEVITV